MTAETFRDAWGVPHLRAADPLELVRLQGRNAATDRAWQIELQRRRFLGTTAAFLGAEAIGWDSFARQARLADTAERCYRNLDDETRTWLTAYVTGVNEGLPGGAALAPEFAETGLTVEEWEPWAPVGNWLAIHIMFAGFPNKLWREHVVHHFGDAAVQLFDAEGPSTAGSNGWLIAGDRTATGAAVVAGDPHRYIESPGVYQQIRLACPEYDVIGLAVPGIPGIAHFGHTGKVAWAITNAMADYQDLYAEQLRRTPDGVEALGPDGWKPAAVHREVFLVAGAEAVEVEVIETDRGPVIIGGPDSPPLAIAGDPQQPIAGGSPQATVGDRPQAISLRYPPRVSGRLGFEVLPKLLVATTVADIDAAVEGWVEPVNVLLAADTLGGLLHRTAGLVPTRDAENQLRVVPAWEPKFEWQGWFSPMPTATVDSFAVMANARELAEPLGSEFAAPHRSNRIRQLVSSRTDWTAAEMPVIHSDTLLLSAPLMLDLLTGLEDLSPKATALRATFAAWDQHMDADSTAASTYAAYRKALIHRLADHPTLAVLENDIDYPEFFFPWLDPLAHVSFALENLITTDLLPDVNIRWLAREALEEVAHSKPRRPWGETHQLTPLHPLRAPLFAPTEDPIDLALSGDHHCVWSTSALPGLADTCIRASAARYTWDLADRTHSAWSVPLGTSGIPGHPHHHDQLPHWLTATLIPITTNWDDLAKEGLLDRAN